MVWWWAPSQGTWVKRETEGILVSYGKASGYSWRPQYVKNKKQQPCSQYWNRRYSYAVWTKWWDINDRNNSVPIRRADQTMVTKLSMFLSTHSTVHYIDPATLISQNVVFGNLSFLFHIKNFLCLINNFLNLLLILLFKITHKTKTPFRWPQPSSYYPISLFPFAAKLTVKFCLYWQVLYSQFLS